MTSRLRLTIICLSLILAACSKGGAGGNNGAAGPQQLKWDQGDWNQANWQ